MTERETVNAARFDLIQRGNYQLTNNGTADEPETWSNLTPKEIAELRDVCNEALGEETADEAYERGKAEGDSEGYARGLADGREEGAE